MKAVKGWKICHPYLFYLTPLPDLSHQNRYEKECHTTIHPKCHQTNFTVYVENCNHHEEKKCETVYETVQDKRCETYYDTKCQANYETVYDTVLQQKCKQIYEGYKTKEKCTQVPKQVPRQVPKQQCQKIPLQQCHPTHKKALWPDLYTF